MKLKRWISHYGMGITFAMPFLILFTIFSVLPIIINFVIGFTNFDMLSPIKFIGFDNYKNLFMNDSLFLKALKNTFFLGSIAGPAGYLSSFLFAWIINNMHFQRVFTFIMYTPSLFGGLGVIWGYLFNSDRYGLINNTLINMGLIEDPIIFGQDPQWIIAVNIIMMVWGSMGTGFLVFVAAFKNNDSQMLEAARIDGIRNSTQELLYIILPQMKPQLLFGAINSIAGSVGISPVFGGVPSPDYVAHTLSNHLDDHGFMRLEVGYAAAISFIMFIMSYTLGKIVIALLSEKERKKPKRIKWGKSK